MRFVCVFSIRRLNSQSFASLHLALRKGDTHSLSDHYQLILEYLQILVNMYKSIKIFLGCITQKKEGPKLLFALCFGLSSA